MLNYLWAFMILIGIIVAAFEGNLDAVCEGLIASSKEAVELLFVMAGVVCMWNGMLYIANNSGLIDSLTKKMKPLLRIIFPNLPLEHKAASYICANFIANIMGLGWACTPTGIQAMKELKQLEIERGNNPQIASNEMCTFLLLNISSLQLIPINMIAYRSQYGSVAPIAVVGPALLATCCTTILAFLICKIMCRVSNHKTVGRGKIE
ncbi:MAG: nucleoside recognition protein [Lachnospiraceae bacterium]|nr:nucleoside recognition protein [Lachnospiraceae bacterium]